MKEYTKFIYLLMFISLLSGCKVSERNLTDTKNSIEITVSCGEDSDLKKYINEGWNIVKEYSEEKICSWKAVPASKNCNIEKDKGCKIIQPDNIGEEIIYLLEK